jgi:hypothetical protein
MREEELKNPHKFYPVKIRVIDFKDVLGLEESLELKKRFYSVKCISQTAEVNRISLNVRYSHYYIYTVVGFCKFVKA